MSPNNGPGPTTTAPRMALLTPLLAGLNLAQPAVAASETATPRDPSEAHWTSSSEVPFTEPEVSAQLDRQRVTLGEPMILTIERDGSVPIRVDPSALEQDFRILDRSSVSELSELNGQRREHQRLRLWLLPQRTGELRIPALAIEGAETAPLAVEVVAPSTIDAQPSVVADANRPAPEAPFQGPPWAQQIEVEASLDRDAVWVGQQLVLRVLVIGDGPLPPGRLIEPELPETDVLILGEDRRIGRNPDGEDGRRWVYERRYALFPRSTGALRIPPAEFSAWRPEATAPETLRSAALSVEVSPAPAPPPGAPPGSPWLPATALSLTEAGASSVRLAPGQVIERMLTLSAVGLRAEDLPAIQAQVPFQLRVREDPPRLWNERGPWGVTGYRTERITLSAAEPGLYQLPAVTIDWWNVDSARWERAQTPAWTLQVAELESASRRPTPDWRRDEPMDLAPQAAAPTAITPVAARSWLSSAWTWLAATMALGLLIAGLWWRRRARMGASRAPGQGARDRNAPLGSGAGAGVPSADEQSRLAQHLETIDQAYHDRNAEGARAALLAWARARWPSHPPGNLSQLALRLPADVAADIRRLDKALYSPTPVDWSSAALSKRLAERLTGHSAK